MSAFAMASTRMLSATGEEFVKLWRASAVMLAVRPGTQLLIAGLAAATNTIWVIWGG